MNTHLLRLISLKSVVSHGVRKLIKRYVWKNDFPTMMNSFNRRLEASSRGIKLLQQHHMFDIWQLFCLRALRVSDTSGR